MKFVAFLRNVNLGQPKSPTREQLETAFLQAGASTAISFLSNGTLIFSTSGNQRAHNVSDRACEILGQVCGLREPAFVRSFRHLAQLVAQNPFSDFDDPPIAEYAITFFESLAGAKIKAPLESARKDCLIFRITTGEAFSVTREIKGKTGYPTPVLERALNAPVTTRSWTTILRMVEKHG